MDSLAASAVSTNDTINPSAFGILSLFRFQIPASLEDIFRFYNQIPGFFIIGYPALAAIFFFVLILYLTGQLQVAVRHIREILPDSKSSDSSNANDANSAGPQRKVSLMKIIYELRSLGRGYKTNVQPILELAMSKGKPMDDRKMTMEKIIAMTSSLPKSSPVRAALTNKVIDGAWESLQHPPLSYLGDDRQYRQPDGSYNNVLFPDLGKAGMPYAKTCKSLVPKQGVNPDPGLLFDLLLARRDDSFRENKAGLSSMLFYHATIIIHDIFRTNHQDSNRSDTSSYLDLAPLYGSSFAEQEAVRTFSKGLLKPDTFHEKRLLAQPPGVCCLLVMYNRFHNYCAEMLLKINEGGRFTVPQNPTEAQLLKQDNDLFQIARLIVGGLYINICVNDYLRAILNTHASNSDWTFDPRVDINRRGPFDRDGTPCGVGNQVSVEFNLLYRFHSIISKRDEKWLVDFLQFIIPELNGRKLEDLDPRELLQALRRYNESIDPDPSKRDFAGIKRGEDGKFADGDLVRILQESMEDPAGAFGPRMVPKALRVVEVLGIIQGRKWQTATLNEFREFFGLKKFTSFQEINPDPDIAAILSKLYYHPDMVELYPGLFIEEASPHMAPGNGLCAPYTVGRAVLSDAVTLVRSDRFYTVDYTAATLTDWGIQEVKSDPKTLGGSMFYKLIQRTLPGWFPFNSLHVMQPMYTKNTNREIAKKYGTYHLYTEDPPRAPHRPVIVTKYATAKEILAHPLNFGVLRGHGFNDLFPSRKDYSWFMLGDDRPENAHCKKMATDALLKTDGMNELIYQHCLHSAENCLNTSLFELGEKIFQIDIVKDFGIPVLAQILGDMFALDMKCEDNPQGAHTPEELFSLLSDIREFTFGNPDPANAWNKRRIAAEAAEILTKTTKRVVEWHISNGEPVISTEEGGLTSKMFSFLSSNTSKLPGYKPREGSLRYFGGQACKLLAAHGKSSEWIAELLWLTAVGGKAAVASFCEVLEFFLRLDNTDIWAKVQELAASDEEYAKGVLKKYIVEAQRLSSGQKNVRICKQDTTIGDQSFKAGQIVVSMLGAAGMDPEGFPDPHIFKWDRPLESYIMYGSADHECFGKDISILYIQACIKALARLPGLRVAPNEMGVLKSVEVKFDKWYLSDDWARLTSDPNTWIVHCSARRPEKSGSSD
ncbi:hypothetical protein TWF281_011022 [Arthrobotrys megalospora]